MINQHGGVFPMMKIIDKLPETAPGLACLLVLVAVLLPAVYQVETAWTVSASAESELNRFYVRREPRVRVQLTDEEMDLLARLVTAEARGESYSGQVAVAAVVLNRMDSSLFPDTLSGVVYEPWQFQPVDDGSINRPATDEARRAVRDALRGMDPSRGALFFFNPTKAHSSYLWARQETVWIGGHRFSR